VFEAELELPAERRKPHLSPFYRPAGYLLPGPIAVAVAFPVAPVLVLPSVFLLGLGWSVFVPGSVAVAVAVAVAEAPPAVWIVVVPAAEPVKVVSAVEAVLLAPSYFSRIPASRRAAELNSIPAPHRSALSMHYRAEKKKKKGLKSSSKRQPPEQNQTYDYSTMKTLLSAILLNYFRFFVA